MGVRALQDVFAPLGDDPRLLGQPLGLVRRARGGAEPRQVDEDVGFGTSTELMRRQRSSASCRCRSASSVWPATRCAAPSSQWART